MRQIMLAPQGAPPLRNERICYFQAEVIDANNTRIGFVGTDAMALVLQEFGFAVMDTQRKEDLTFGQAVFLARQGKIVRRLKWGYAIGLKDNLPYVIPGTENPDCWAERGAVNITWEDILARDWLVHE